MSESMFFALLSLIFGAKLCCAWPGRVWLF